MAGAPNWLRRRGFKRSREGNPVARGTADAPAASPARPRRSSVVARELGSILQQLVRFAIIVVEAIIAVRIVLRVLGADPLAPFTRFMYGVSGGLVSPFRGGTGAG